MVKPNDPFCFSLSYYGVKIFHLTSFYLDGDGGDAIMLLFSSFYRLFLAYPSVVYLELEYTSIASL